MSALQILSQPVPLKEVTLTSGFLKQRQDTNRKVTLPMELEQCRRTGAPRRFQAQLEARPTSAPPPLLGFRRREMD